METIEMEDGTEGMLTDVGFMFDAFLEKVTCSYNFGANADVSVLLTYAKEEPGALQSGHYVWPAAPALCEYLTKHRDAIPSGNIVELGAGCGLTGLTVAQLRPDATVIFTDHDPGVLKVISHNASQQKRAQATCHTKSLRWGPDGIQEIEALEKLQAGPMGSNRVTELIVGSDVIYAREVVPLLFWTVDRLLSLSGMFLMCSSFCYDEETETEIDMQSVKFGLKREIIECSLNEGGTRIQCFTRTANR
ncbi:Predicted methyltransferase [Plasmopara halstedii]|uniref:Predicted methyltransferase n=1 Tax=Plasmopara halstedii TaxID=4781 RepID=A0A0N7L4X4_PLAHL|nr:Predicted methyltransferase [Plasmopara halstedii]CEG39883.1 Predicted methyltransferase [Plasmopara halstedii]|eukprot:XP_024576252.1 Predicted methyltransferase [Plasmopara halstedii]